MNNFNNQENIDENDYYDIQVSLIFQWKQVRIGKRSALSNSLDNLKLSFQVSYS